MEGTSQISKSSGSNREKSCEEEQDRISRLPDSILVNILSLLPAEEAVKTIIFSGFRQVWTFIHTLDLNECSFHVCRLDMDEENYEFGPILNNSFLNFIRHALVLHQNSTIYKFRLRFLFFLWKEREIANEIDSWILFAIRKEVKVLDLDFSACEPLDPRGDFVAYKLPTFVFNSDSLTVLKLTFFGIEPQGQIHMKSLKIFYLANLLLTDKLLDSILCGCPLLEDLFLVRCCGLFKLNYTGPNIKNVTLRQERHSRLYITCPNLVSFHISEFIELVYVMNLSSLVSATVNFTSTFDRSSNEYPKFRRLLGELCHCKVITLCNWSVLVLTIWVVNNLPCPSGEWKHVVLRTRLTKFHIRGIYSLLRNSPCLEELTIYVNHSSSESYASSMKLESYDFDRENYQSSQKSTTCHCLAHHLKRVNIHGCITEYYVIQLVEFLLKSARVLEKMVISFKCKFEYFEQNYSTSEKMMKFSQKLFSFPKASADAVILIL